MENTMLIEVTNQKALKLLHELEELHLIKVLKENFPSTKTKLSDKDPILQELKEAIQELKLVEQGKLKARPAKELLNEL